MVVMLPQNNEQVLAPPPHLSASSLATFEQCPLKFRFSKIDHIPDKPGIEAILGNFVHDVLEALYAFSPEFRTKDTARDQARSVYMDKYAETVQNYLRRADDISKFRWQAWFCIENLWLVEDPTTVHPIGLESEFNHLLGGVALKGYIDRYTKSLKSDNGLTISDYKTGKTPRVEWVSDKFEQLRIYAAIMQEIQIFPVTSLELIYLRDGVKFTEEVTPESLSKTIGRVTRIKEEIDQRCQTGEFEAVKSKLCDWCSYKPICPVWGK